MEIRAVGDELFCGGRQTDAHNDRIRSSLFFFFFGKPKTLLFATEVIYAFHIHLMANTDYYPLKLLASVNRPVEVGDGILQNWPKDLGLIT